RMLLRRAPDAKPGAPTLEVAEAVAAVKRYFEGEETDFSRFKLDLGEQDPFFQRIYATARQVGWGRTTTYGALGKELGAGSEAARDVGQAMAKWAPNSGVILAENKQQGQDVEKQLIEDSDRFPVYAHLGQSGNWPVPNRDAVINALSSAGYRLGATDELSDKYGPGVDYFHDQDKTGAERVAAAMKEFAPDGSKEIHARLQPCG